MEDELYFGILQSVQASVATVLPNTVLRRKLYRLESDVLPICYVVPAQGGGSRIVQETFAKGVWYSYPVTVAYLQAGAEDLTTGLQRFLDNAEAIRDQLYQVAGVPQAYDFEMDPDTVLRFAEFVGTDFDVWGITMQYKVPQTRAN